jgi:UPF0271 protein
MKHLKINCDVGEGVHNEAQLMPYIESCNIACGGHAGTKNSMQEVVELALKYKVKIGAHPSYPDSINFGRKTMAIEANELKKSIQNQIHSLIEIVHKNDAILHHIKPHGALYNDIAKNKQLAAVFLEAIVLYKKSLKIYVPYNSEISKLAIKKGYKIRFEAFADRNYNDDLSLVSRTKSNAIITNPEAIFNHINQIITANKVTTLSGKKITIKATTFCVHSDTNNAVKIVKYLHQKLVN